MNVFKSNRSILIILFAALAALYMTSVFTGDKPGSINEANLYPNPAGSEPSGNTVPAPDFSLTSMEGDLFTLSDHAGKVIVLNIWATWCPPCREEIPEFIEIQDEMEEDVLFVGVSMDEQGWDVVRPFAEEYQVNYPLVVDDGTVSVKYGPIQALPMTFLINRDGEVELAIPGMVNKATLQPILEEMVQS
jgi:thiol-disulfide isomerase/thioredoxin